MFRFMVVFVLFVSSAFAGSLPESFRIRNARIVGGREAHVGQFPYQASLRSPTAGHFCGGAIISHRWIATAAHCTVNRTPSTMIVVLGAHSRLSGGTTYGVSNIVNHPSYNRQNMHFDVSVVQTSQEISFDMGVMQVRLASNFVGDGQAAIASGWGQTTDPGSPANILKWVQLRTIDNGECRNRLDGTGTAKNIHETNLCTTSSAGQGTCMGDSGGPLVANEELVGLVSWGIPCARGRPDVFVRVDNVRSWILSVIQ